MKIGSSKLASALGLVVAPVLALAQSITLIGGLPGETASTTYAVRADGLMVVGLSLGPPHQPLKWTAPNTLTVLGSVPNGVGGLAAAISANGNRIAGQYALNFGGGSQPILWDAAGNGTLLTVPVSPNPMTPHNYAIANGLSADGSIAVGYYRDQNTPSTSRGFRWTSATGLVTLGLPPGTGAGLATSISADGSTIVGDAGAISTTNPVAYTPLATIWTSTTSAFQIGTLPSGTKSSARAVSADGSAVAGVATIGMYDHAFRWTANFGMEDLGFLPGAPSYAFSDARVISSDGSIVGGVSTGSSGLDRAVISGLSGWVDLNTYLPTVGVNLTGWTLTVCTGMSADGRTLSGNGSYLGKFQGWVVRDIPSVCAPKIFTQPFDTAMCPGTFGFLSVTATPPQAAGNLHYQWYKQVGTLAVIVSNGATAGGSFISGAKSTFLSFSPGNADVAGSYFCVVNGGCTDVTTSIATVTMIAPPLPGPSPLPLSICSTGSGGWLVNGMIPADGPYTQQWYFENGLNSNNWVALVDGSTSLSFGVAGGIVSGSTTPAFIISAAPSMTLKAAHSTRYRCRVFNACTFTDSAPGSLKICIGDANCDGQVDDSDFVDFATAYDIFDCADPSMPVGCPADMNGDGFVDDTDFVLFADAYDNLVCP